MLTVLTVGVVKGVDVSVLAVDTDAVVSVVSTGVLAVVCDSVVNVVGVVVVSEKHTHTQKSPVKIITHFNTTYIVGVKPRLVAKIIPTRIQRKSFCC